MKNLIFILIAMVLSTSALAQFKINYGEVKTPPAKGSLENGVWYGIGNGGYVYTFKQNAVGVMKALNMTKKILEENGLEYDVFTLDESLISSLVKDMTDYENLDLTIRIGQSNIERSWKKGDGVLKILLNDESYMIITGTIPKKK